MQFTNFLEVAAATTIPFAADFFNLPIFFTDWKATYKTVSAIFAGGLYAYIRLSHPNDIFLPLETWWMFFLAAFVLLLLYIGLHIYNNNQINEKKKRPILIIGLFVFTIFYTSLTVGFSLLFQNINYVTVRCNIKDNTTKKPIEDARVALLSIDSVGVATEYNINSTTNSKGKLKTYILKDDLKNLKYYEVYHVEYKNLLMQQIDISGLSHLNVNLAK